MHTRRAVPSPPSGPPDAYAGHRSFSLVLSKERPLSFDLFLLGEAVLTAPGDVPATLLRHAVHAERVGFSGVWFAEHHFIRYGACPSPVTLAAAVLGATTTLHVGTAASTLSVRHPVALAEEAVMLDAVSGGRFMLGVARGGTWVDMDVFGTGEDRRDHGFQEGLTLIRDWLSGGTMPPSGDVPFRRLGQPGAHYPVTDVPVLASAPTMPWWVAAVSRGTVEAAAALGASLLLGVHCDEAEWTDLIAHYDVTARSYGHDPSMAQHAAVSISYACDDPDAGREQVRTHLDHWLSMGIGDYRRVDGTSPSRDQKRYVDGLVRRGLIGPIEMIAAQVRSSPAPVSRRLLLVECAGPPDAVTANIERLSPLAQALN